MGVAQSVGHCQRLPSTVGKGCLSTPRQDLLGSPQTEATRMTVNVAKQIPLDMASPNADYFAVTLIYGVAALR